MEIFKSFNRLRGMRSQKEKPWTFVKRIIFNDETILDLDQGSIVIFVGPNNCGKSQVLKEIEAPIEDRAIVIKSIEFTCKGDLEEESFFKQYFILSGEDGCYSPELNLSMRKSELFDTWKEGTPDYNIFKAFTNRLSIEKRSLVFSGVYSTGTGVQTSDLNLKFHNNNKIAQKISGCYEKIFGVQLASGRSKRNNKFDIYCGNLPCLKDFTMDNQDDYYKQLENFPLVEEQGDGMKSVANILIDTFITDSLITLIDEPEAFLHPPQSRLLGNLLARELDSESQLFISTHSASFIRGIIESNNRNVIMVNMFRNQDKTSISILDEKILATLKDDPIIRYSNVLEGIFYTGIIICESDYDSLFYSSVVNDIADEQDKLGPDILFTHCGGKPRIKMMFKTLRKMAIKPVIICDFDFLFKKDDFESIISEIVEDNIDQIKGDLEAYLEYIKNAPLDAIKKQGKYALPDNILPVYRRIECFLNNNGIFPVPYGEMESFYTGTDKSKRFWVYEILEKFDLAKAPELQNARDFLNKIVEYVYQKG